MYLKRGTYYAADGTDAGSAPETSAPAAAETSYSEQFGGETEDRKLDFDKIKPSYEPIDFEAEEAAEQTETEGEPKTEEPATTEPEAQTEAPKAEVGDYEKLKSEYEEYKKSEEQRFNQYYANLEAQRAEKQKLQNSVESLFTDESFVQAIENAEDGKQVAKTIMAKTVEIADQMIKQTMAPIYKIVNEYQQECINMEVDRTFNDFKSKYGDEAAKCLQPGSPENKALVAEMKQNPNLPLEKAFLLARPNFVKAQVNQEVKKVVDHKASMAIAPSTGKSMAGNPSPKINSINDAIISTLREIKKR